MAILRTLAVTCALLAGAEARAKDAQIDLVSADGPDRTCPQFRHAQPAKLRRDAGRTPESFSGERMILRHFYWVN